MINTNAVVSTCQTARIAAPVFRLPTIADAGNVRLGAQGPVFRIAIADAGKVRLGAQGPIFR